MRAVVRLGSAVLAAGLALGPTPSRAQDATEATTNAPAADVIGPRELRNFTLNGTVTRPAETAPAPRSATPSTRTPTTANPNAIAAAPRQSAPVPVRSAAERGPAETAAILPEPASAPSGGARLPSRASSSVTVALPPIGEPAAAGPTSDSTTAAPQLSSEPDLLAGEHRLLLWPWLLAALALGAGGAFLFWRNRSRHAFAGGAEFDAFSAPELAPRPVPAPPNAPRLPPIGIVSTRLRPWIDLIFEPLRFVVEGDQVTIEFGLGVQNSGNAPARGVLVEASMFNAGPNQDREIGAFFESPVGEGERIALIDPLKTVAMRTKLAFPRESVQLFEIGGRQVFVPLVAFNALYRWSGGEGQTSVSYLLGRDTKGAKMAPFRLDLGPRQFRGVGARPLPASVRD